MTFLTDEEYSIIFPQCVLHIKQYDIFNRRGLKCNISSTCYTHRINMTFLTDEDYSVIFPRIFESTGWEI